MIQQVKELLAFINDATPMSGELAEAERALGTKRMRGVGMSLLGWLKAMRRERSIRPLPFREGWIWCDELKRIHRDFGFLKWLIDVEGGQATLREDLPLELREEVLQLVDAEYHPRLWTLKGNSTGG